MMVTGRLNDTAQWIYRPAESFAVQRRWHFGRPIVVGTVIVEIRISERLANETVQTRCAEIRFEVFRSGSSGVDGVALAFSPLCSTIFEPYLYKKKKKKKNSKLNKKHV